MRRRRVVVRIAVGGASALAALVFGLQSPASASGPVSGEGSLTDTQNAEAAALSDASANTGLIAQPLKTAGSGNGCGGYVTKPAAQYDGSSDTLESIFTHVEIYCVGYNNVDLTVYIQRHRWYGWQPLHHVEFSNVGNNYRVSHNVATDCRAGTWSYRTEVAGGWDGDYSGDGHTESFRHTCVNKNDATYIDLS
jgi:hypothetical protein